MECSSSDKSESIITKQIYSKFSTTHVKTHKLKNPLQTSCNKSVHKLLTSYVRTACSKLSEQIYTLGLGTQGNKVRTSCSQFVTRLMGLSDLLPRCSNKSDTVMITTLLQPCVVNFVTILSSKLKLLRT